MSALRLAVEVVRWGAGFVLLWSVRGCRHGLRSDAGPMAVVVPARDEETNLPALLASLSDVDARVIVVADDSADATAAVASAAGASVMTAAPLEAGVNGKAA